MLTWVAGTFVDFSVTLRVSVPWKGDMKVQVFRILFNIYQTSIKHKHYFSKPEKRQQDLKHKKKTFDMQRQLSLKSNISKLSSYMKVIVHQPGGQRHWKAFFPSIHVPPW